jgi:hypothetical protein
VKLYAVHTLNVTRVVLLSAIIAIVFLAVSSIAGWDFVPLAE